MSDEIIKNSFNSTDGIDPEANFEEYKKMELNVLDTQIIVAKRVDAFVDIRDQAHKYFGDDITGLAPELQFAKVRDWQVECVNTYKKLRDIVDGFTFEQFSQDDIDDPFDHLITKVDNCYTDEDVFLGYLGFLWIRPFAERVLRMHALVLNDIKLAKAEADRKAKAVEDKDGDDA